MKSHGMSALAALLMVVLAAGPAVAQGRNEPLPMPGYKKPQATWVTGGGYTPPSPPAYKGLPQPPAPTGPRSNMAPAIPQAPGFKPFQGGSVYSDRGGVNAYPQPKKPPGAPRSIFGDEDR